MDVFVHLQTNKAATAEVPLTRSFAEWAVFVPTDEVLHTYTLPLSSQRGFNKSTVSKPVREAFSSVQNLDILRS